MSFSNVFVLAITFVFVFTIAFVFVGHIMSPKHCDQMSQKSLLFEDVFKMSLSIFGQVMSPHHSDQFSQRSQVSRILCEGCSSREVDGYWVGK